MIVLNLWFLAQAHHAQGSGDGADTRCKNGADEQDFGVVPDPLGKDRLELSQHMYNRQWQVPHVTPFLVRRR